MKKPFGTRLLAACLSVVMLTAMVPPAWAAEDTSLGNDAVQAPLTSQPESPLADGDGADDTPEAPIVLRSVSLDQQSMSLKVGERGTLTAKLTTTDGTVIDYIPQGTTVHWESNAPDEVKVLTSDGSLTIQVEALKTAEPKAYQQGLKQPDPSKRQALANRHRKGVHGKANSKNK